MTGIDHRSPLPLHIQLKQYYEWKINRGELKPGDRIPTEEEICRRYRISRTPVRQALMELVREGLLTRTAGRGTFVADRDGVKSFLGRSDLQVVFSDSRWQELLESAARLYNAGQTGAPMELNTRSIPLWDIHDYLMNAVGQGEAPDISVLDSVWVAEFANQHHLVPLDEADPLWYQALQKDSYPAMLAANQYHGHLWGIPVCGDASVLWYRRDWFTEQKLVPPTTWGELVAVARFFKRKWISKRYGPGLHPFLFVGGRQGGETTTYQLLPFLWAAGGELVAGDRVVLNSPATLQAFAFLRSLIHEHRLVPADVISYSWNQAAQEFASGRAAMALGGTYDYFFIREIAGWDEDAFQERVSFVPIPAGPDGEPTTLVGGMNFVLYRQSSALAQALPLLKMTVEPEILKPFCVRTGQIPARRSVADALRKEGQGFVSQTVSLLEGARTRPSLPGFARVSSQFRGMVEDCLSGKRSVEEAVSLTAEKISAITDLPLG